MFASGRCTIRKRYVMTSRMLPGTARERAPVVPALLRYVHQDTSIAKLQETPYLFASKERMKRVSIPARSLLPRPHSVLFPTTRQHTNIKQQLADPSFEVGPYLKKNRLGPLVACDDPFSLPTVFFVCLFGSKSVDKASPFL